MKKKGGGIRIWVWRPGAGSKGACFSILYNAGIFILLEKVFEFGGFSLSYNTHFSCHCNLLGGARGGEGYNQKSIWYLVLEIRETSK